MARSQELATLSENPSLHVPREHRRNPMPRILDLSKFMGPHPGTRTFLRLTAMQPSFYPRLAEYSRQLQDKLTTPTMLPTRFALPVGNWEINGQLSVEPGREASTEVLIEGTLATLDYSHPGQQIGTRQRTSVLGLSIRPAIDTWTCFWTSLIQPFGQPDFETSFNWNSGWSLNARGQAQREAFDFGGSISVGRRIQTPSALSVRPIVGLHLQTVGVIQLDCVTNELLGLQPGTTRFECTRICRLTKGWALMPLAAMALEYNPIPGAAALASGFRLSLLHATGKKCRFRHHQYPTRTNGSSKTMHWQVDTQRFHGWQIRVQASIALAFLESSG